MKKNYYTLNNKRLITLKKKDNKMNQYLQDDFNNEDSLQLKKIIINKRKYKKLIKNIKDYSTNISNISKLDKFVTNLESFKYIKINNTKIKYLLFFNYILERGEDVFLLLEDIKQYHNEFFDLLFSDLKKKNDKFEKESNTLSKKNLDSLIKDINMYNDFILNYSTYLTDNILNKS